MSDLSNSLHNPEAVEDIKDYKKELNWFLDHYEELKVKYNNLYVGVQDQEVRVAKETIEEVKEGVDTDRVYLLKYIPLEYKPRILGVEGQYMGRCSSG